MKYRTVIDGEWTKSTIKGGYKIACCDCGLVHKYNFRVIDGELYHQAFRHIRATAQMRRYNNLTCKRKEKP